MKETLYISSWVLGTRSATERLCAVRLDPRRGRLRNVPLFVCGVSVEDVVCPKVAEGILGFDARAIHIGHST